MIGLDTMIEGVLLGGVYALFALGLSLIFGIMRLVNLAHGDLILLAAYLVLSVTTVLGIPLIVATLLVVVVMFVAVHGNYCAGPFVGIPVNKSNGGVRSSKISVVCRSMDCCRASSFNIKFASPGFWLKIGSTSAAAASPSPWMRLAISLASAMVSAAWRSAVDLINEASFTPSNFSRLIST